MQLDAELYPLGAQSFRRRWNSLLEALDVPLTIGLTPSSVRGGGAVAAYRAGLPIQDSVWKMRIQHVHTLQHYLQEMAADNVLAKLSLSPRVSFVLQLPSYLLCSLVFAAEGPLWQKVLCA